MADPFSAVASSAGLVSLAIQLVETAQKLRKFRSNYKNAVTKLEHVAFQVETLSIALRRIDAHRFRYNDLNDELLRRSLLTCRQNTERIVNTTTKIGALSEKWKPLGKASFAIKKSDIDSLLDELDQSITSMHLAWAVYVESARCQDRIRQQATLTAIYDSVQTSPRQTYDLQNDFARASVFGATQPPMQRLRVHRTWPGADQTKAQRTNKAHDFQRKKSSTILRYKIGLPSWLSGQIWHFAATSAQNGWHFSLTTTRTIPSDAEVFEACFDGDLARVQRLFIEGQASVLDEFCLEDTKDSPLAIASLSDNPDLCRYLVQIGKTIDHWHWNTLKRAIAMASFKEFVSRSDASATKAKESTVSILLDALLENLDMEITVEEDASPATSWTQCLLPEQLNSLKKHASPAFLEWPPESRLCFVGQSQPGQTPEQFLDMCGITYSEPGLVEAIKACGTDLLLRALHRCEDTNESLRLAWIRFAITLRLLGAGLGTASYASPIHFLMTRMQYDTERPPDYAEIIRAKVQVLRDWVSEVHRLRPDLIEYGKEENSRWNNFYRNSPNLEVIEGIHYGPTPAQWMLKVQGSIDIPRYQLQCLPGAWPNNRNVPDTICWEPSQLDIAEGFWRKLEIITIEGKLHLAGAKKLLEDRPANSFSALMSKTQDDASTIPLLSSAPAHRHGRRSSSQPPNYKFLSARAYFDKREHIPSHTFCLQRYKRTNCSRFEGCWWYPGSFTEGLRLCAHGRASGWTIEMGAVIGANMRRARVEWERGRRR